MKKLIAVSVALAAFAAPVMASAAQVWDPSEGEFITLTDAANPANAAAAKADQDRYVRTVNVWDPAEGEFVATKVGDVSVSAVATNDAVDAQRPMKRVWDPAEGEFQMIPAN